MSNFTNAEVVEYRGEKGHISILLRDNKKKYHVLYAKTGELNIEDNTEYINWSTEYHKKLWYACCNRDMKVLIPIFVSGNSFYHIIDIDKKEDFELVDKVVSTLLED